MFTALVLIGTALAPAIVLLGRLSGLDRDRAMYPIALIVIAPGADGATYMEALA